MRLQKACIPATCCRITANQRTHKVILVRGLPYTAAAACCLRDPVGHALSVGGGAMELHMRQRHVGGAGSVLGVGRVAGGQAAPAVCN